MEKEFQKERSKLKVENSDMEKREYTDFIQKSTKTREKYEQLNKARIQRKITLKIK